MSSFIDGDKTIKALQFSLDGLSKRVQVASNDIANADTPNYKASEVTFEGNLRKALRGDGDNPLPLTLPTALTWTRGTTWASRPSSRRRC
jgi:flagellar basal-body rod protein FlgB